MSERQLSFLLEDIADAIGNILTFTRGLSFELYEADLKTRQAVERNFMIIGEAVARIPEDFKTEHTEINWRQVKDFRNVIVHDYFGIDHTIVWDIIQVNLSELLKKISALQNNIS